MGELSAFRECIVRAYGSPDEPDWGFVRGVVDRNPYRPLFDELALRFPVEDDTDVNCDVSFTFLITGKRVLSLKLSMVGPYATLLAVTGSDPDAPLQVVSRLEDCANDDERAVFQLVTRHGFRILTTEELETSTRFRLEDTDIVPLYRALFAFEGLLPWR
ncbi:hypothetical protein [Amycolatopsis pigmentata]|uniref:Uncharacterized protein n=1 Tax=Amycolatopsis pigmentata TaxID=450801 RepID=A0ABW5G038_9PSEU